MSASWLVKNSTLVKNLEAEIERLLNAIKRIDGINDNPADYNPEINAVCDTILRPELIKRETP